MDKCNSDAEFDSYWDNEAKNQNRNRIRVGRQYQATIPPILKPGQKDGRKLENLETLKWKPDQLDDQSIEEYLSMAKGIGLFSKSLGSSTERSENTLQSALKGLSEFVTSHHPCHHDDGCKVARPSSSGDSSSKIPETKDWSSSEAQLFAQALDSCGKNFSTIKTECPKEEPPDCASEEEETIDVTVKKEETSPFDLSEKKVDVKEEPIQVGVDPPQDATAPAPSDNTYSKCNFLENTRVTDPCRAIEASNSKAALRTAAASSSLGSLKFFLGGRLVLRLNAQQDGGSGNKCQWVQSNDLPKHTNSIKRERHKKRFQDDRLKKKSEPASFSAKLTDSDPSVVKKPKLYDFVDNAKQTQLMCSSSWMPPVADGRESIEVDECSSKTSEGYVSPVLLSAKQPKPDCNSNSELGDASEAASDSASKSICVLDGKNSPSRSSSGSPYKQENHKSALGKSVGKSLYYAASHSSNQLYKHWNKWPSSKGSTQNHVYPLKGSPTLSPLVETKGSHRENPLDLSSKLDSDSDYQSSRSLHKSGGRCESLETHCEYSPRSSNHESQHNTESSSNSVNSVCKCSDSQCEKCSRRENFSPSRDSDSSQLPYSYNLSYHYALPKCTKDLIDEMPLDLSSNHEVSNDKKTADTEHPNEALINSENSEAVDRGMLYQLLKNKTSK